MMHDPHDNAGPRIRGLSKDRVTAQEDLAAFDQLGPLTRKVINEAMCVSLSSRKILQAIKQDFCADPLNSNVDRAVAETLLRANADIIAEIRVITDNSVEATLRMAGNLGAAGQPRTRKRCLVI
jgi:hypothetical protein